MSELPSPPARVKVWDLPTRLVHWLIVALVGVSWWTAEEGKLEWHRWSGYTLAGVLGFRIFWGFFGGSTARFSAFVRGPGAVVAYLRGAFAPGPGHNPLGALSVVALLLLLIAQIALGLFAIDVDGIESGPLSHLVSFEGGRAAADWHEGVFELLKWLIALHVVAVFFYLFARKQNLIGAMLSGKREFADPGVTPLVNASRLRFIAGVVFAAFIAWAVSRGFWL
jgi:cytochrome b